MNVSISQDSTGAVHVSFVNLNASKTISIKTSIGGISFKTVDEQIITSGKLTDINTYNKSDFMKADVFKGAKKRHRLVGSTATTVRSGAGAKIIYGK